MPYDELVKRLRRCEQFRCRECEYEQVMGCRGKLNEEAADAIEKLSAKVDSLQLYVDNISKLPDCNTCLKNSMCEFRPKLGEYCRINCPAWLGKPPKEET